MFSKQSHFLTKLLTPAFKMWLSSQLETVQGLQLQMTSSDQQFLQGIIPKVVLKSDFAIYQGLQFDQISLTAEEISINLNQLLKGQPLQPLQPILLSGNMRVTQHHLQASLQSLLLQSGLQDFLSLLLKTTSLPDFYWEKIILENQQFLLQGKELSSEQTPILIQAQVTLATPQCLIISPMKVEGITLDDEFCAISFDLGSEVQLEKLQITTEAIFLQGELTINP